MGYSRRLTTSPQLLDGCYVLVVDDNFEVRRVCEAMLTACGATVATADSAEGALALIQMAEPDAIVLDISMPEKDGFWLLEQLRARHGRMAIIAITAFIDRYSKYEALTRGFDAYLAKPFDAAALSRTVAIVPGRA